jgi:hypothetical protein
MLARLTWKYVMKRGRHYRIRGRTGEDIVQQHDCCWASWPEMVSEMKTGDFSTVEGLCEKEPERRSPAAWFAVVDDIGQLEDTSKGYLLGALGRICEARLGSWTVWTSNLTLAQISERLDNRISSRMIRGENVVVENDALDFNLR